MHVRQTYRARCYVLAFLAAAATVTAFAQTKPAEDKDFAKDHPEKMAKGLDIFKQHVRPVLVDHCLKCHGGNRLEGGLSLVDRPGLVKGGDSGPAVLPGKAKDSLLFKLVSHAKTPNMPFERRKLPDDAIAKIADWIDHGAPYDKPLIESKESSAWTRREVPEEARKFWSFQKLQRPAPPKVKDEAWGRTAIDRFIRAKQEAAGIAPNPPVGKALLIRRAYLDLLGMPPTPEEVQAFVNDPAADAFDKALDRLLASQHYGERWGRHWLDLARFGESHGFEHDYDRPTAYHYRDFVIQALNQDLPYDQFVKWQIAGDEYEPENNLALMATGFLAAGVHSTQITKNEVEKHRYDEMDDMLATIGTSMLGLTIGCARCHDHKFDPFPQADYYRLLSTFTTTVRSEVELDFDREGYRLAKQAFDREHAPFEEAVRKFEKDQLPGRLAEWEKTPARESLKTGWVTPQIKTMKSSGQATLTAQEDGSILVTGKNPTLEALVIVLETDLKGITGIRLEALADSSLAKGGPGRAANGNFALTDFQVMASPKEGKAEPVKLKNPRATFEQKGFAVAGAIDADPVTSGWAVDPQFGKDHAAAFEIETPVGFDGGTVLGITLKFNNNVGHGMGRPRLSLTTNPKQPELNAVPISPAVLAALEAPAEKRSDEQKDALLKWYRHSDPEWQKLDQRRRDHLSKAPKPDRRKVLISTEGLPPLRLHSQGEDFFKETFFLRRGDCDQKERVAPQGYLQVLMKHSEKEKRWRAEPAQGWRTSHRRRAFAEWLTDVEHGGGALLARVIVNRLWQHHMGRGLVATPSDFGARGELPTHPELLDWLAGELIQNGWRLKPIHKLIMASAVYRQDSTIDEAKLKIDRNNQTFWRRPSRRLEAEAIRDSLLAVSGMLDARMFGPGTLDEGSKRRSIYFTVKRSKLIPMMQIFDAPEALTGIAERPTTTIAPQALWLMNNPHVRGYARGFAQRIDPDGTIKSEDAVGRAYEIALTRPPTKAELAEGLEFVQKQIDSYRDGGKKDGKALALADFCQVVMCLNEFIYVD